MFIMMGGLLLAVIFDSNLDVSGMYRFVTAPGFEPHSLRWPDRGCT